MSSIPTHFKLYTSVFIQALQYVMHHLVYDVHCHFLSTGLTKLAPAQFPFSFISFRELVNSRLAFSPFDSQVSVQAGKVEGWKEPESDLYQYNRSEILKTHSLEPHVEVIQPGRAFEHDSFFIQNYLNIFYWRAQLIPRYFQFKKDHLNQISSHSHKQIFQFLN